MSQTNVIITSGSKNQIIHVPVVSAGGTVPTFEIVTSSSGSLTISRNTYPNTGLNQNSSALSPQSKQNRSNQSSSPVNKYSNNRHIFVSNEDNSDVKAIHFNRDEYDSREQLLLPTDAYIKQEEIDNEEYEEYESMDEEELEGAANSKTQYKCSGCGKGFCYTGWLDRHKLSSPACREAHAVKEKFYVPKPKESPNTTTIFGTDRSRPSLEGRLNELLCCPNEKCTFTSHWVQSLNKHVANSCKFTKEGSEANHSSSNSKIIQVCHLCNKGFNDNEQHIQHMKNSHQIKLFYQCSECKINFDNKHESDAHIEDHNRMGKLSVKEKMVSTPVVPKPENNGLNNGSQQYWKCELCNKSYLSLRSYEIHRTSCEKVSQTPTNTSKTSSPPPKPSQNSNSSSGHSLLRTPGNDKSIKHFTREQIEAIHNSDFRCKYCRKSFQNAFGLCNHLSRRPYCREWYYTNLPLELMKNNSLHLMERKRRANLDSNSFDRQSSPSKPSVDGLTLSPVLPRKAALAARRKSQEYAYDGPTNSARCDRCRKIFVGKNPTVALTNHLRGSTCIPTKYNPFHKPQVVRSRTLNKAFKRKIPTQNTNTSDRNETRFYCKLCPRKELKNRVSLGCHLTIYHGLPQVNVTTAEGDAFRCQTCSQVFSSKYFYNLHRQDCDLTSPYVGIICDKEKNANIRQNQLQTSALTSPAKPDQSTIKCELCGKTGFLNTNQIVIHQKYQCIKRRQQISKTQPNVPKAEPVVKGNKTLIGKSMKSNGSSKGEAPLGMMCDSCGRGPYNSYHYFLEHKKKYCEALKGSANGSQNKAKKSFVITEDNRIKESFCLNPTIPRAKKTMNYPNVSSPQVSHASSIPMETNENESEEIVVSISEVTKCSVCLQEFEDVLQFIRHRLSHITHDIMQSDSIETLDCELCGARVHHYQRIQQHLILHLQNVQILKKKNLIEVTKRTLEEKYSIDESDDEDQDGSDEPVLHCPYCKAQHNSRVTLADHIKNTCPFRYQCPNCNNTYSAKESFLEHREECLRTNINKIASKAPTFKCRNCNLEFKIKQQLLWHEHACNKVYTADHSGRVEEVIERTLSCSVCGLVSDVYEHKVKHEFQCLNKYLAVIGNQTEDIKSNGDVVSKPISLMDFDLTSLSNTSESSEVPEELINNLKQEFGIQKEVKVVLNAFDEEIVRKLKTDLYCEREESVQFETLKETFLALVRRLIKSDELLQEISQESNAQTLLTRMLKYLGEEPIEHNGLNELNCFRQNLQTFLKLTIKDDTLVLAYRDAESVDEAVINMLNFECELHC